MDFATKLRAYLRLVLWECGWHSPKLEMRWMACSLVLLAMVLYLEKLFHHYTVMFDPIISAQTVGLILWTICSGIALVIMHWLDSRSLSKAIIRDLVKSDQILILAQQYEKGLSDIGVTHWGDIKSHFLGGEGTTLFFDCLRLSGRADMII